MKLSELKDYIKSVSLAHKKIQDFYIGSSYNEAEDTNLPYPLVFYELPYYIQYNLNPNKRVDNVQFAYNVLVESNVDKALQDHDAISQAKEIGDDIITYILCDQRDFIVSSITAVSVREFGSDSVAGIRFEWQVQLPREACETDYADNFNPR
jgi:ABC-type antimicrobial peptide transport system permease subunit